MRGFSGKLVAALLWALLTGVALVASVLVHLPLPLSRDALRDLTNQLATGALRGGLHIGYLDRLGTDAIEAREVRIFDPDGRPIIYAERVRLVPDWGALLQGKVHIEKADLHAGTLRLVSDAEGIPSLIEAFEPVRPSPAATTEPVPVIVDGITLHEVRVSGDVLGLEGLRANVKPARGRFTIRDELEITIEQSSARVSAPFTFDAELPSIRGSIHTDPQKGLDLQVDGRRGEERVRADVRFAAPRADADQELDIRIHADPVSGGTLAGLGFEWADPLQLDARGDVHLHGPPDHLTIEGDLQSTAGKARLDATIADATGVDLRLETPGLRLDRVNAALPRVEVSGHGHLNVGPEDEALPRVEARIDPLVYEAVAVPRLVVKGVIETEAERFRIASLKGAHRAARISGHGTVGFDGALDLHVRAHVSDLAREPNIRRHVPGAHGQLDASIHAVARAGGTVDFHGSVTLQELRYGYLQAKRLEMRGSARGDPEQPRLDLQVDGEALRVESYALGRARFRLNGGPRHYTSTGSFALAGSRTFSLEAGIEASREGFVVNADHIQLTVGKHTWRGMLQALRVDTDAFVELGLLRLASRSQRLEARGLIRFQGDDRIEAQLQDFDVSALQALLGRYSSYLQAGRLDMHVTLSGDVRRPQILVQGALRQGRLRDVDDTNALYFVTYGGGELEVDGEVDLGDRGLLTLRGTGTLDPTLAEPLEALQRGAYSLQLKADSLSLDVVRRFTRKPLGQVRGSLGGTLEASGTLDEPALRGRLQAKELVFPGWSPLHVTATLTHREQQLESSARISDDAGLLADIEVRTALSLEQLVEAPAAALRRLPRDRWSLELQTFARRLDALPSPMDSWFPWPLSLRSTLQASHSENGTRAEWQATATWEERLSGGECARSIEPRFEARVTLHDGVARLVLDAQSQEDEIASFEASATPPVDAWLAGERSPSLPAVSLKGRLGSSSMRDVPWLCQVADGPVRLNVEARDLFTDDPSAQLTLQARTDLHVPNQGRTMASICGRDPLSVSLRAKMGPEWLRGRGTLQGCGGTRTRLGARLPVRWAKWQGPPRIDEARSMWIWMGFQESEIRPLLVWLPAIVDVQGLATGSVTLQGSPRLPELNGELHLRDGALRIRGLGQHLSDIQGDFQLHRDWIEIQRLKARDGRGTFEAEGGLAMGGWLPRHARLKMKLSEFPTRYEGISMSWLSGRVDMEAAVQQERTDVHVSLDELEVRLPEEAGRTLQPLDPHRDVFVVGRERPTRIEDPHAFHFFVDGREPFWVRRDDFEARVRAELDVTYRDPMLGVEGYIRFDRGTFEVLGKSFTINQGRVNFDGGPEFDPEVNLRATYQPQPPIAGSSPVQVTVTGHLDDLDISFASEGCEGQTGALAMLLSGRCTARGREVVSQDDRDAMAAGLVGGVLTLGAQKELGKLMPLISIESAGGGYHTRVRARFDANSFIPGFLRGLVRQAYVQGAVTAAPGQGRGRAAEGAPSAFVDFLLELYFPNNLVGTGRITPQSQSTSWGVDLLWEP